MKRFIHNLSTSEKIEFWAATSIFVLAIVDILPVEFFSSDRTFNTSAWSSFWLFLFRGTVVYLTFILLNFIVLPRLFRKEKVAWPLIAVVVTLFILYLPFGEMEVFLSITVLFCLYTAIKYSIKYLVKRRESLNAKYHFITSGRVIAFALWIVLMLLLMGGEADRATTSFLGIVIPFGIILHSYSFNRLIPNSLNKSKPFRSYLGKVGLILIIAAIPVGMAGLFFTDDGNVTVGFVLLNTILQLLLTVPLSWWIFVRHMKGREELYSLKKELGNSTASIDFLRSQINPHFLFNALNTLYGTAIQEKAERTSEGIQQLGDMMRFMLHENMQEKIPLAREIDYLNNYIHLQRLRTDSNPKMKIEVKIEQAVSNDQIAPMLLIPFVENAFKHGLSLREPSEIKVKLEVKNHTILFNVQNSKHKKQENDPEKHKSGVGLNNVKQRLQLLYPSKHELNIRETDKNFFVYLTFQLS